MPNYETNPPLKPQKIKKPLSEGFSLASGLDPCLKESGRSGEAGYTDPNNKYYHLNNLNECRRDFDAVAESLIGVRSHHLVSCLREYSKREANARLDYD